MTIALVTFYKSIELITSICEKLQSWILRSYFLKLFGKRYWNETLIVGSTLIDWQRVFYSLQLWAGQIRFRYGLNTNCKPDLNTILKIIIRMPDMNPRHEWRYWCRYGLKLNRYIKWIWNEYIGNSQQNKIVSRQS